MYKICLALSAVLKMYLGLDYSSSGLFVYNTLCDSENTEQDLEDNTEQAPGDNTEQDLLDAAERVLGDNTELTETERIHQTLRLRKCPPLPRVSAMLTFEGREKVEETRASLHPRNIMFRERLIQEQFDLEHENFIGALALEMERERQIALEEERQIAYEEELQIALENSVIEMKDRERAEDEEVLTRSLQETHFSKPCSLEKTIGESLEEKTSVYASIDDNFFSFLEEDSKPATSGDLKSLQETHFSKPCSLEKTIGESLEEKTSVCASIDDNFFSFLEDESESDASGDLKSPPEDISNVKK
jgi:hypothetical protein